MFFKILFSNYKNLLFYYLINAHQWRLIFLIKTTKELKLTSNEFKKKFLPHPPTSNLIKILIKKNNFKLYSDFFFKYENFLNFRYSRISKKRINNFSNFSLFSSAYTVFKSFDNFFSLSDTSKFKLIGGLISPYTWEFENKKKWFRKLMTEEFEFTYENETSSFKTTELFYKNLYFNNFLYFNKLKYKFSDFYYFLKISNLKLKTPNDNSYVYTKPYSNLIIPKQELVFFNPYVLFFHFTSKQYQKHLSQLSNFFKFANVEQFLENSYFFFSEITIENLNFKNHLIEDSFYFSLDKLSILNFFRQTNRIFKKKKIFLLRKKPKFFLIKKNTTLGVENFNFFFNNTSNTTPHFPLASLNRFLFDAWPFLENFKQDLINLYIISLFFIFSVFYNQKKNIFFCLNPFFNFLNFIFTPQFSFFKINFISNFTESFLNYDFYFQREFYFLNSIDDFENYHDYEIKFSQTACNSFNDYYPIFLISKHDIDFILDLTGFGYLSYPISTNENTAFASFNIKKKYFSFPLKNELQKFMIKKYIKNSSVYALFEEDSKKIVNDFGNFFSFNETFFDDPLSSMSNPFGSFLFDHTASLQTVNWNDQMSECDDEETANFSFFIKKIKFKPGYMTFWRESRSVFKEILNLNFKYQYKLTRYLTKFNKILKFNLFINTEMTLENILVRSRFFFDWATSLFFINQGLIFVNGAHCINSKFQTYVGDFIQMIIHHKYYILYRWYAHWINKKKLKIKIRTKKKLTISTSEEDKDKTHTYPKWLLSNRNITDDSAKFLEIDFLTLSIFIVYEPFMWHEINIYSTLWTRYAVINMYNWKYIT